MRESIFFSSMRSFFTSFFAIIGLCFGLIPAFLIIGSLSDTSSIAEPDRVYTAEVVAKANNTRQVLSKTTPTILKLNISGIIGTDNLNMNSFKTQLIESREGIFENNPIKAILLHIQSPGGTVIDADGIYRAIKSYKEQYQIPVYAYVDGLCASGGMYIAAAADKIYASDVSLIGSIGVISPPIFNFSKTMEKLGVEALTLSAGIGKDDLNSFRQWNPNEGSTYQNIINTYYDQFVQIMTSNRPNLDKQRLISEYGASIFSANQAKEYGFIDESGISLNEALKLLTAASSITDEEYQVVQLDKKNWYKELFGNYSSLFNGKIQHQFDFDPDLKPEIKNQFLYLYRPGL